MRSEYQPPHGHKRNDVDPPAAKMAKRLACSSHAGDNGEGDGGRRQAESNAGSFLGELQAAASWSCDATRGGKLDARMTVSASCFILLSSTLPNARTSLEDNWRTFCGMCLRRLYFCIILRIL